MRNILQLDYGRDSVLLGARRDEADSAARLEEDSESMDAHDPTPSPHLPTPASFRIGVDLVSVTEVAASIERFGDRYLQRLFTAQELASCAGTPARTAASLAARFAAKEATIKVLRPEEAQPEWRSIEVVRLPGGACDLRLSGAAARLADEAGLSELEVSLTHQADLAAAVVVGLCRDDHDHLPSSVAS